jgi:PIN domain nuclease of toxin-antitoxin system
LRVLLDSHTLLWMLRGDPQLSGRAAEILDDPSTEALVSAVTAYELCYKSARGKLTKAQSLCVAFEREIAEADCRHLPLTLGHALAAASLDPMHRDPFDRLLIAQALVEQVPIVSNETLFDQFGVQRIW